MSISRRAFIQTCSAISVLPLLPACTTGSSSIPASKNSASQFMDEQIAAIVKATTKPTFPDRDFNIVDFGAQANSNTLATAAIKRTIQHCHNAGGGRVVIPAGDFTTGAIHLLSNVNLHLSDGATLRFSTNPQDYLPAVYTHWEGIAIQGYSPLIYANGQRNIAITGNGVLDGMASADNWWTWKGSEFPGYQTGQPHQGPARQLLFEAAENNTPVEQRMFAEGSYLRPSFIQPVHCENILIEDVTIKNAPFWLVHPLLSRNVTIKGIRCESHGPNSDGCDPESCQNVVIEDCYFDTGDDCIAIKSGRNNDGRRIGVATQQVVIRNCVMRDGHGGVVIGSEISAGVNNVFVDNCEMSSPELERAIRLKTNATRGGTLEHLYYRNIHVGEVRDAFVINFYYEEAKIGGHMPVVRNIHIENFTVENAKNAFLLRGFEEAPINNITLMNVNFKNAKSKGMIEHVNNLQFENVSLNGQKL